jgi:hypothetical protein
MTEPSPDLDERLTRLAARQAGAKPSAPRARTRRKHPAAAARILSLGLSSSAFLSIIGVFGEQQAHISNLAAARPARPVAPALRTPVPTKVVVKYVHHRVYVDRYGRPVAPAIAANGATATPANHSGAGSTPRYSAPPTGFPASTTPAKPAPRPTTPPPTAVTTPPPPPPPACSGTKCP